MGESRLLLGLEFRDDPLRELLSYCDAPLVERVMFQITPCVKTLCS